MITKSGDPVAWAGFMYELEDAKEHLTTLISDLEAVADYDEANLRVALAHVFSHLNRAWHRRNAKGDFTEEQWTQASQFPKDLDPI